MADAAKPNENSTAGAAAGKDKSAPVAKPERPDEEVYKKELAQAEKELRAAEDRMVGSSPFPSAGGSRTDTCM
jgi:hypothetical protein